MAQGERPADAASGPPEGPGPSAAGGPATESPQREASTRPLEATSGVPDHGEREPIAGIAAPPAPAGQEAVRIIEAPEARPVSEMAPAITPSEMKPVLPDEKGVVVFEETARIDWGEGRGEPAGPEEGRGAGEAAAGAEAGGAGLDWGEPRAPAPPEGPSGLPSYPPLPRQYLGTGKDIRMFIRNGTFMFLAGSVAYFVIAAFCLGVAFQNAFDRWAYQEAADFAVAGFLALGLSVGAFACMLLSRYRLEEPLRRNDVEALRRRLLLATGAGLVLGLVLGGLLLYLALLKVGELPVPRPAGREEKAAPDDG